MSDQTPPPLPPISSDEPAAGDGPIPVVEEASPVEAGTSRPHGTVENDKPCFRCSYNLRGLPVSGVCPECGSPVLDSLRGVLLFFASPEYLARLGTGLGYVLVAAIITIVLMAVSIIAAALVAVGTSGSPGALRLASLVLQFVGLAPALLAVYGYWLYTDPDPAYVGTETPDRARRVLRAAVVVEAAAAVLQPTAALASGGGSITSSNPVAAGFAIVVMLAMVVGGIAWIAQFFSAMSYSRWIAVRVPDAGLQHRAKLYMWLLPLLFVVGYLCIGLGPLIAMILYLVFLNTIRLRIAAIRAEAVAESYARSAAASAPPPTSP